jgi:hypothetical protein
MSFFKKLGETVIETATTVGNKSADLVEQGKLKVQKNQLEGSIKDKKYEIGNLLYNAYKQGISRDETTLNAIFSEIADLENQISVIDEKFEKVGVKKEQPASQVVQEAEEKPVEGKLFCASCGQELTPGAKFCKNCGSAV